MEFVHTELKRDTWFQPAREIRNPKEAVIFVKELIANRTCEMAVALFFATSGQVVHASICSEGTASSSMIPVSEILRIAILSGASGMILLHNHPSGSLKASKEDMRITKKLSIACQLIGIDFLDQIIVGGMDDMVSLREERTYLLKSSKDEIEKLFVAENRDSLT